MQAQRGGTSLKIHIRLAVLSLEGGSASEVAAKAAPMIKGKTVEQLRDLLCDLRRKQVERGIIKPKFVAAGLQQ